MEAVKTVIINEVANKFVTVMGGQLEKSGICSLLYAKDAKLLKRGNPLKDNKVEIVSEYTNISIGHNYQDLMQKAQERSGATADYSAEKPNGLHFVDGYGNNILQSDKDETSYSLRLYRHPKQLDENGKEKHKNYTKTTFVCYLVDGIEATPEQVETIKMFLPAPKKAPVLCEKQINSGITEEVLTRLPFNVKIENILKFKFGVEYVK